MHESNWALDGTWAFLTLNQSVISQIQYAFKTKKKKKNSAKWEKLELSKKVFSFNVSYKFRIYYRADNSFTQWGKEEPCKILYIGPLIGYSYKMLWLLYPVVTFCHIL